MVYLVFYVVEQVSTPHRPPLDDVWEASHVVWEWKSSLMKSKKSFGKMSSSKKSSLLKISCLKHQKSSSLVSLVSLAQLQLPVSH